MERPGILGRVVDHMAHIVGTIVVLVAIFALWRMGESGRAALWSGIWRTIAWVVIVAGLPWTMRPFMKRLMEQGTNWAGVAALGGLVLADIVVALLLMTVWPASFWGWVAALAVLGAAGTYNYLVLEYLSEQTGL